MPKARVKLTPGRFASCSPFSPACHRVLLFRKALRKLQRPQLGGPHHPTAHCYSAQHSCYPTSEGKSQACLPGAHEREILIHASCRSLKSASVSMFERLYVPKESRTVPCARARQDFYTAVLYTGLQH